MDIPTHSRVYLYFYYFLHCRIIVKTSKLWNNTLNHVVTKKSVTQIKIYFIFKILYSCHHLPWLQLWTLGILSTNFRWLPGVMFADNGALYACVDMSLKISLQLQSSFTTLTMSTLYFWSMWCYFNGLKTKCAFLLKTRTFLSDFWTVV